MSEGSWPIMKGNRRHSHTTKVLIMAGLSLLLWGEKTSAICWRKENQSVGHPCISVTSWDSIFRPPSPDVENRRWSTRAYYLTAFCVWVELSFLLFLLHSLPYPNPPPPPPPTPTPLSLFLLFVVFRHNPFEMNSYVILWRKKQIKERKKTKKGRYRQGKQKNELKRRKAYFNRIDSESTTLKDLAFSKRACIVKGITLNT